MTILRGKSLIFICFTVGLLLTDAARVNSDSSKDVIGEAYTRLAKAYENADQSAMQALLAPTVVFTYTNGSSENLEQTIADWKGTRQRSPDLHVSIDIKRLVVQGESAEAEIALTQTYLQSGHHAIDVQVERDQWERRNGTWLVVSGHTIDDTVSLDGRVVGHDSATVPLTDAQRAALTSQLVKLVWAIRTATPDDDVSDLEPLRPAIGSARVVAMGEATHGTSEFFSIKDRILRFLVSKMGFTVFAMEIPWTDGLAVDSYVTTGKGNIRNILGDTFAVWDNQEVLDLIEWMRGYNAVRGTQPILHFVGVDMQDDPARLTNIIVTYLKTTRSSQVATVEKQLSCLHRSNFASTVSDAAVSACIHDTASIQKLLTGMSPSDGSGPEDDLLNAQHAAVIANQIAATRGGSGMAKLFSFRDKDMAVNTEWFAHTAFPKARIALWAHNAHVMSVENGGFTTMGTYLRRAFGPSYYVIGFAFDTGTISPNGVARPIKIAPAPSMTFESVLRTAGLPLFGLNLRSINASSPLGIYLSSSQPMRMFAAVNTASQANDNQALIKVDVKAAFDSLIFVERSHAAHSFQVPTSEVNREVLVPAGSGGIGWITKWGIKGSDPQKYEAGAEATSGSLYLSSSTADPQRWGATVGTIPVDAYRGKRIRLTGEVKTEGAPNGGSCWMRVDGPDGATEAFDNMSDRLLIGSVDWKAFSIVLDVPDDATNIAFGLVLRGRGEVFGNHLRVDIVNTQTPATGSR